MKNIYRNYNEEDLIVAYLHMTDHTGTINNEMREVINQKFDYNEFVSKAENRKILIKEKGRVAFEVYHSVQKDETIYSILNNISSEMMDKEELKIFILEKFDQFSRVKENDRIDKKTIYRSLLGIIIASINGLLFLYTILSFTSEFSFFLLIPIYILNYLVIRWITKKTRDNIIVFLAVLISVIISTVLPFILLV
ncbi:hypothetical protein [Chryseobacterium sp. c4a]|uniref:hypothetical protein n=1 Tax=Chryseobacterium sp. c4a TaxID=1573582 RepID=UPI00135C7B46|nr:hypothetical protein [Chryseobacterium sp. c4a]